MHQLKKVNVSSIANVYDRFVDFPFHGRERDDDDDDELVLLLISKAMDTLHIYAILKCIANAIVNYTLLLKVIISIFDDGFA